MNEAIISHDGPGHRYLASLGQRGMQLGLGRIEALLERLGRPQDACPVVAVAGSDGKGSTSAMLTALLRGAGLRVAHYTSPHLVETRERLHLGQGCVSAEALDAALLAVQDAAAQSDPLDPTPFEALTAAALWHIAQVQPDVAVLEVGLGGRLDAVNATDPVVSVVTNLSLDHTAILGDTLQAIAYEKAGIARHARALICAQPSLLKPALRRYGVTPRLLALGTDIIPEPVDSPGHRGQIIQLRGPALHGPVDCELALPGRYQADNAALAVLAYLAVAEWQQQSRGQLLPPVEEVVGALAALDWPCRAEWVSLQPRTLVDAAHNPAGIAALARLLQAQGGAWQVVLAVRRDRDAAALVSALAPVTAQFWLPRCSGPTLMPAAELAQVVQAVAPAANVGVAGFARCLHEAQQEARRGGPAGGVAVTGSQHALGEWLQSGALISPRLRQRLAAADNRYMPV